MIPEYALKKQHSVEIHAASGGWSADRVATLRRLWGEGKSASEIAKTLTGLSRSAVIGKVHRLGLSSADGGCKRSTSSHLNQRPARPRPDKMAQPSRPVTVMVKPGAPPASSKPGVYISGGSVHDRAPSEPLPALRELQVCTTARPWLTRKRNECAWPVGEPDRGANQLSCCGPTMEGATYCAPHLKIRASGNRWGIYGGGAKELERALQKHVAA